MRVVADTGPLHYLLLIGAIDILLPLFDQVVVSTVVRAELLHDEAPPVVRAWAKTPPAWLTVLPAAAVGDPELQALDDGERTAIELAVSLHSELILMDDRRGVAAARGKRFVVMGTLGVLDMAASRDLIDLPTAFPALRTTSFHVRQDLLDMLLAQHQERSRRP